MRNSGQDPYPAKTSRTISIADLLQDFDGLLEKNTELVIAGRVMTMRDFGNLQFAHIFDGTERIQIALSKKEMADPERYKAFSKLVDMGDFVEARGKVFVTHKGEKSVMVEDWKMLTKSLLPLPDKFHGLQDEEEKLRKRYLDILLRDEERDMIVKRAKFWQAMRTFLVNEGFIEVETPVLEVTTGGADAKPFITHHNALDMEVFLRISMGELWQKKLMVAGLPKTFEIGRQFRNEGMSTEHLQDYTQMEFYWAYANYEDGMALVERMYKYVIQESFDTLQFKIRGFDIDFSQPWKRYDYRDTVKNMTGIDVLETTIDEIEAKLKDLKIDYDKKGFNITRAIDNLWKYCRKQIAGPGFLVGVPVEISPLAKRREDNSLLTQRFQPIIAGSEVGNGYSELNDPIDQAGRFAEQQKLREAGDEEAQMFDHEFVEALEHGMPPTCGFGVSERLFAFLMDRPVRECQIFPLLKPKVVNQPNAKKQPLARLSVGISHADAVKILDKYIDNDITKLHCYESEAIMRSLAKKFGEDEDVWGIAGLLHDIDWEITKNDTALHTVKAAEILRAEGASEFLIEIIASHTYGSQQCGAHPDKSRSAKIEHALAAAETLTGLIIASALMQPDKKLSSLTPESLKKKFKNLKFAANCDRAIISECEEIGMSIDEFLGLGLASLQEISEKLGM